MTGRALMVQGVSSDAGKSFVVTALCRWLRRRGLRVAPFKAQNMSNNARVVDGGEIGTAQWLQALAAGVTPDVRMNPVLLKPQSDTSSQVVLDGRPDLALSASPWRGRSARLWPHVVTAYRSLEAEHDVVVIEGAGSPAETNLWDDDLVNMRVAELADAPVLLVADIDRGGAFAHLFGTWALLPPVWQGRLEGFLLNKFRGDATLLEPAPADLERRTRVPVVGTVPFVTHGLPDEEGPTTALVPSDGDAAGTPVRVGLVCGPYASNLDEFVALQQVAAVRLVRSAAELGDVDLIVLPGSKHTAHDLAWLRATGLADAVMGAAGAGVPILGICGGLQLLGRRLDDPHGVESSAADGLGLLDVTTTFEVDKVASPATIEFDDTLGDPWTWLAGRRVEGYEIRHGRTAGATTRVGGRRDGGPAAYAEGNVLGTTVHGIFEDGGVVEAFAGRQAAPLDASFDALADLIDEHVDTEWIVSRTG